MPIDAVRMYNGDGNLVNVVTAPQEMDTSFINTSVVCDVHFPLVSTPGNVRNDVESGPEIPATSTPLPSQSEAVSLSELDAGVCADMAVEVPNNPICELKTSVCKAIAKLLGLSSELREFDMGRSFAKSKERPLPIHLKKHKKWDLHFRRLIRAHKASIKQLLANHPPDSLKYAKDISLCLQLVRNLH